MIELPLQSKFRLVKIIGSLWGTYGCGHTCGRLGANLYGLAHTVAVIVLPYFRETVFPCHRLQMDDSALRLCRLEMIEPPLTVRSVNERTLMGSVDIGRALLKHPFLLGIRSVNAL